VKGALIALTVNQAILLIVTIVLVVKSKWFHIRNFMQKVEWFHIRNLLKYTFMAMLFGILTPIVQIGIRNYIAGHADLSIAGYWDGMTKLSQAYLTLITTTISVYFLPKYSKLKDKYLIKKEIFRGYKILVPLMLTGFVFIFLIRFFIIDKLYSREFYPMASLFLPQLISDFFQMASWLVSYLLIAKAMLKLMVITQVTFAAINYGLSILMFTRFGIEGVVWGAVIRYILYSLLIAYLFRDYLTAKKIQQHTE
jgi:PST family polysaccharide transporter